MSYLKIFPRSLSVKLDGAGAYVGNFYYDFEQYGCMVYGAESTVKLLCLWNPHAVWVIRSTEPVHKLTGYAVFMEALNHYLFNVVRFDPVSQWCKVSSSEYEYHFENMYFDLGTQEFTAIKKLSVADSGDRLQKFFRLKLHS